jgi:hypothetical protein
MPVSPHSAHCADDALTHARTHRHARARKLVRLIAPLALALASWPVHAVEDIQYLRNLLAATPEGGWVQANTNKYSDAWTTGPDALPPGTYSNPAAVVYAWSSFAWDPNRGHLLLWGGGHANYMGNEIYVWQGSNGLWTRGSVPSRVVLTNSGYFIADGAAPQSSHTYDNNIFAPVNDLFFTFGGAAFQSGGDFTTLTSSGAVVRAGPWAWDPAKADPTKVGGTTGSGYNPSTLGGQMWSNLQGQWTGQEEPSASNTAYRLENGKDVFYVTGDQNASGFPSLYRYELGAVRAGQLGRYDKVAVTSTAPSYQSTGTIDSWRGLYVRTSNVAGFPYAFGVWQLSKSSASNPGSNPDIGVELVQADGSAFPGNADFGIDFDDQTGKIVMWDGSDRGTVWETEAALDAQGNVEPVWLVTKRPGTSFSQPRGDFGTGVLGKWHFVSELGAYIALDEFNPTTGDAGVWLYKPYGWRAPTGTNAPPQVNITSPTAAASFASPASISIAANATDADGIVTRVDFYVDQALVGTSTAKPFAITSVSVAPGVHSLTAAALDNSGASTTSSPVAISVGQLTLSSSANPALSATPVTLTAQVIGNAPTGTVAFSDAGQAIAGCTGVPLTGTGNTRTAACVTSQLAVGVHSIRAVFGGNSSNVSVTNAVPLSQVIVAPTPSWFDDALPAGAVRGGATFNWVSTNPVPYSGVAANQSALAAGIHQQYFVNATNALQVGVGEILYAYVYLDPANPPSEVMLQWNDGTWEHRAYWGPNLIAWGTDGTSSRRRMGALPPLGQWVRLEVPAAYVGLEQRSVNGLAFTLYDGRATWDAAGKSAPLAAWVNDAIPPGGVSGGTPWTWVSNNPLPFAGSLANQSTLAAGIHQNFFYNAAVPLQIGVGDVLYAYVYLDPLNPPAEVMMQWNDGTWEHRAYWGANLIAWGTDGSAGRRFVGPLPVAGQWVRLEVPAAQVGLEGRAINGLAFTLYGGRATWDAAGKATP